MTAVFPARFGNERDVEVPLFLEFLREQNPASLLDVGAHYTHAYYAREAAAIMGDRSYAGIDLADCPETRAIITDYRVADVMAGTTPTAALVSCISTLEHFGKNTMDEHDRDFAKVEGVAAVFALARQAIFLTFPFGKAGHIRGEYSNMTPVIVEEMREAMLGGGFDVNERYFMSETPQTGGWCEIPQPHAAEMPLRPDRGVECICVLTGARE